MQISFSPVRCDDTLTLSLSGDVLTVNGVAFDFTTLSEGQSWSAEQVGCPWLAEEVRRQAGELCLCLILPHGADAPDQTLFPQSLRVTQDGSIPVPQAADLV
jgi:hypothetical protein